VVLLLKGASHCTVVLLLKGASHCTVVLLLKGASHCTVVLLCRKKNVFSNGLIGCMTSPAVWGASADSSRLNVLMRWMLYRWKFRALSTFGHAVKSVCCCYLLQNWNTCKILRKFWFLRCIVNFWFGYALLLGCQPSVGNAGFSWHQSHCTWHVLYI